MATKFTAEYNSQVFEAAVAGNMATQASRVAVIALVSQCKQIGVWAFARMCAKRGIALDLCLHVVMLAKMR